MLRRPQSADVMEVRRARAQSMRRVIIKQGYLKKIPRLGSSFKKADRRWFVFGIMNNTQPYMEYYENEEGIFSDTPINIIPLDKCKRVIKNQDNARYNHMFSLVLVDRQLSLVAPSRSVMFDWVHSIEDKLKALGIIDDGDGENDYVMNIASLPRQVAERQQQSASSQVSNPNVQGQNGYASTETPVYEDMWEAATRNGQPNGRSNQTNSAAAAAAAAQPSTPPPIAPLPPPPVVQRSVSTPTQVGLPSYSPTTPTHAPPTWEDSFLDQAAPDFPVSPGPHSPLAPTTPMQHPIQPGSPGVGAQGEMAEDMSLFSSKMREAYGLEQHSADAVGGWNSPPPASVDAPPPYIGKKVLERNANRSLKLSQVEQLEKEISNQGGVQVVLKKVDIHHAVALVDCFNAVWIAGWNQRARPFLHNAFHIGDRVISINGQVVETAKMAKKLIKHCSEQDKVTYILRRVPHARVFAIKRDPDGESLGITCRGGTAEIIEVKMGGTGARHGVPSKAPNMSGDNLCNWCLTEINQRPLNLFFREGEIEKRLNAVGVDISIMIQPMEFIVELKKQLKIIKNYKDFIVQ